MDVLDYFSPSSLDAFYGCRQQWAWSRPGGYQSSGVSFSLELGTGVHHALAEYYRGRMDGRKVNPVSEFLGWIEERIDKASDVAATAVYSNVMTYGLAMLEGYVREYEGEPFDVLAVEETITRQVPGTDWNILVRVDAIVRNWRREVWVLEHKTFTSLHEDYLYRHPQFALEAWAAKSINDSVKGTIYNGIRKHIPTNPRVRAETFVRRWLPITRPMERMALARARDAMQTLDQGHIAIYPNPSVMGCSWCSYKEPCNAKIAGKDYRAILAAKYVKRIGSGDFEMEAEY